MANTLVKKMNLGNGSLYVFETTSAATTETLQLPPGKSVAIPLWPSYVGGTPTAVTTSYVRATGVLSVIGLTGTNNVMFAVLTD